jgi:hypothetical protein
MRNIQIPWESYTQYQSSHKNYTPDPTSSHTQVQLTTHDDRFAHLNTLAEAKKMMGDDHHDQAVVDPDLQRGGEGGMSFTMLAKLISEGKVGDVGGIQQIPEGLNVRPRYT